MTDIGTLPGAPPGAITQANGINNRGQIVGSMITSFFGLAHAVLWDHGQIIDLGTLPNGNVSVASGINMTAQISGTANRTGPTSKHHDKAVRWTLTP
jgi:probable HAF family extracellular repeat protein